MDALTRWNWQHPDWPRFVYSARALTARESLFLHQAGVVVGTLRHFPDAARLPLVVELVGTEALKTSAIEGEYLDRASVQSSLRRQFGLPAEGPPVPPAEQGIAELMGDLYRRFAEPLDAATLGRWQAAVMAGNRRRDEVGVYRTSLGPMQVVSGRLDAPKVHFEAPPSAVVPAEMARFIDWFNATAPTGPTPLPALTRAALAHLHFESIHPFADGNGRVGRALAEKVLAQGSGQPSLTALSLTIDRYRRAYYAQLAAASTTLQVDDWIVWFADIVLEAQRHTLRWIEFLLAKTRLLDRLRGRLNARQEKGLLRMLEAGPEGFEGGLSSGKYQSLTGATPATAGRDLAELVACGALQRTGEKRGVRYWLPPPLGPGTSEPQ